MKTIMMRIEERLNTIKASGSTKDNKVEYQCSICKDIEYIIEGNKGRDCKCKEAKKYKRMLERSGISKAFQERSFSNFNIDNKPKVIKDAREMAISYVESFNTIKENKQNSIAFLGQVGSGKTHLSIAIGNALMKENIGVLYRPYREAITALKQNIMDEVYYQREIARYKCCSVLLIDDLFKGKISNSDINIIFEIINYRYLKGLPIIVSSECKGEDLLSFDEALGSRIIEMCRGKVIELEGDDLNHRLNI